MRPDPDKILWLAAFDGGKALIFRNEGFDDAPDIKLLARFDNDNPPDREQTTDAPGRFNDAGAGNPDKGAGVQAGRSSVEQTDRHELEKVRFVDRLIERLNLDAQRGAYDRLVVMAADKTLGEARDQYHKELERRLELEKPVDVMNEPAEKIEARLKDALAEIAAENPRRSHLGLTGPEAG